MNFKILLKWSGIYNFAFYDIFGVCMNVVCDALFKLPIKRKFILILDIEVFLKSRPGCTHMLPLAPEVNLQMSVLFLNSITAEVEKIVQLELVCVCELHTLRLMV
jgi:hypothetical protein